MPTISTRGHLLRILGVGFGIAVGVGNTIGSAIFRTPGNVATLLKSSTLILAVWVACGVYALLSSSSVIELSVMLPRAGGWYVFARRAFGEYGGFVVGCIDAAAQPVGVAYMAVALGEFATSLDLPPHGGAKLLAVASVVFLTVLNWLGLRSGSRTQALTSLAKALGLIVFVIACFHYSKTPANSGPFGGFSGNGRGFFFAIVGALQVVIVTYDGWYAPIYFAEEDEDPARNLPRSIIGSVLCCIAIFLLVNLALLFVLPMAKLAGSQVPVADAAMVVFGARGKQFMLLLSIVAVISTINATLLIAPRILFAMSRDGLLPHGATSVNKGGTPAAALLFAGATSIALILSGSFETLAAIASILYVLVYMSGFAALLVLRKSEPQTLRTYKAWYYPWTTIMVLLASAAFLIASVIGDARHSLFAVIPLALTYPLYTFFAKKMTPQTNESQSQPLA